MRPQTMQALERFFACFFCMVFSAPIFGGVDTSSFVARVWKGSDGLPGDNVTGIAQTEDGYLWLATQNGLAGFDGVRIKTVSVPGGRADPLIWAMLIDRDQQLWLATDGGVLIGMDSETPTKLSVTDGLSGTVPASLIQAGDGAIWISYVNGMVCRIGGGQVTRFSTQAGLTGGGICYLTSDSQGRVWFAKSGRIGVFRNGKFVALATLKATHLHIQTEKEGGVWICADDQLFTFQEGGNPLLMGKLPADSPSVRPTALFEDRSGALWIGTAASGLFRFDGKTISRIETSHSRIRTVTEDREGNIWVGTSGGGLNRLRQGVVTLQGKEKGLPFETVRSVCEDSAGNVWVITQDGQIARTERGVWKTISNLESWPGGHATCVTDDPQGGVWIGTYSRGLYRWTGDEANEFRAYQRSEGLAMSGIRALMMDKFGNLWIGSSDGNIVQKFRNGQFERFVQPPGSRAVRAMVEDAKGNIWMGTMEGALLRLHNGNLVDETARTMPTRKPIRALAATDDGSLWIGYSSTALGRFKDGRFSRVEIKHGLFDDSICSIEPDDHGRMWIASDHGIFHVKKEELDNVAEGKAQRLESIVYGHDDGLPSLQAYYGYAPTASRCRDGRILIATHLGLVTINPALNNLNPVPPQIHIENISVDNVPVSQNGNVAQLELSPKHRKIEVAFSAPSFIAPEQVKYRYFLKGWDENWVDADTQTKAVYSRLPAGKYEFRVVACNSAGVWSKSEATFAFIVQPFFWQTWWCIGAIVLLSGGLIVAIVRYISFRRLRMRLRQLEEESALQRERARIARDIHDDLGARLTQISLLGDFTQHHLANPEKSRAHVSQISAMARQGMKALDEIVWAVNPRNDSLTNLLDYIGQFAVDFLDVANIRCRIDFPGELPPHQLSAEIRYNLLLTIKEALNNIAKHSCAREVWLHASVENGSLRWNIKDNGRGFSVEPDDALADGLRNMRQRMEKIGGSCSIESSPGAGVQVVIDLPLRPMKNKRIKNEVSVCE